MVMDVVIPGVLIRKKGGLINGESGTGDSGLQKAPEQNSEETRGEEDPRSDESQDEGAETQ